MGKHHHHSKHCNECPHQANIADIVYKNRTTVTGYGGVKLTAYTISSGTGGKNILFVHGFAHSNLMWKNQFLDPALTYKHNIYAYDWRGMGESERPSPTGPGPTDTIYAPGENMADDLDAVITALGLSKVVLVSHSYGGAIVGEYFRNYGQSKIEGWIRIASETGPVLGAQLTPDLLSLVPKLLSTDLNVRIPGVEQFIDISSKCKLDTKTRDHFIAANYIPADVAGAILSFQAGPRGGPVPPNNIALWGSITIPVLFVHGEFDDVVLLSGSILTKAMMTSTPAKLSIYKTGHLVPIEDYKRFNHELLDFVASL